MCGIAGYWLRKPVTHNPLEILQRMGDAIAYRGPDDSGFFSDSSAGIGLVHRRLSILDLSPAGHQPMPSDSGRYVIIFNGEVYNFQEIRAELGKMEWRGHSDTEVMLAAIERWGLDAAVQRFVGMFAFALWDEQEKKLSLVRDRLGIKPFYYGHVGKHFVFASELKAISQFPGFHGRIDRDVLALFMRYGYVPAPHSIYEGFKKLQPGCILSMSSPEEDPQVREYWSAFDVAMKGSNLPIAGKDDEVIEELHKKLKSAVGLRMIADVPLGAFLSGGIDSSVVVALMQAQSSRPVKTFTIGFHEKGYNEAVHAKNVAHHIGTEHTELYVTPQEALNVVPLLHSMYDEPFADPSQIPTYLVSKLARGSVTVSLSGDGGDELFGGYSRYLLTKKLWGALRLIPQTARLGGTHIIQAIPTDMFDLVYRCIKPFVPKASQLSLIGDKAHKLASLLSMDGPNSLYLGTLSQCANPQEFVLSAQEPRTVRHVLEESAGLPNLEERMMLTDLRTYLPDDILTKVDRASMAVSLEARVPLLDHRVVEFASTIPLHMKIRDGVGKWVLRQVLYKYVPQNLVERPKMGFGVPIEYWLRGPLRDWAEDLLSEESLRSHELLNVNAVRKKWAEHVSGRRNWQYLLWNVLIFQDWHRHASRYARNVAFANLSTL